jgi:DNA-binding winged helix-turn-helix (wHTH) protein/tetratricopeptide (TPR) repeat protein/TolB-like protein
VRITLQLKCRGAGMKQGAENPARTLRFGLFEVDLQAGELRKHGVRVKLQEQPFQILTLLLERPGSPVTREDLRHKLWPAHTFVDFDRSLNKAMTKLRSALGDSADSPRFIETLHRRGYRFLVPVTEDSNGIGELRTVKGYIPEESPGSTVFSSLNSHTSNPEVHSRHRGYYVVAAGGFLLACLVALIILRAKNPVVLGGSLARVQPRRSIAVLGFKNLSGDARDSWLSTALADWLSTELAAGDQLRTIPAETVARMKMEVPLADVDSLDRQSLALIRKNLSTDFVVTGSYAMLADQSDGQMRLDLRLQDTHNGETVDAISETGSEGDLFGLVSRGGEDLRAKLGIRAVTSEESAELATALPANSQAARLYSEGVDRLRIFDALSARDLLLKAIAAEPNYAASHAALSAAWSQLGYDERAMAEAKQAYELAVNLPHVERLLVEARYLETSHQWTKAIQIYSALFEVFPDNLDYGLALASAQGSAGKWRDSLQTIAALQKLPAPLRDDPRIDLEENLAAESLGDLKGAEAAAAQAAAKAESAGAWLLLAKARLAQAWAYENLGDYEQVPVVVEQAKQLYLAANDRSGVANAMTIDAIALQAQGNYLRAKDQYEQSIKVFQETGNKHSVAGERDNIGDILYYLGDLTGARKSYEHALASYEEVSDPDGVALAKNGLGNVYLSLGNLLKAKAMFDDALAICDRIGDRDRGAVSRSGLGGVLRLEGDIKAAEKAQIAARDVFEQVGDRSQEALSYIYLAQLFLDQGKNHAAVASAQRAADIFDETKAFRDEASSNLIFSLAFLGQGQLAEAEKCLTKAAAVARQSHNRELEFSTEITEARVQIAHGGTAASQEAARRISDVLAETTAAGFSEKALEARLALGEIEMSSGNLSTGQTGLESLKRDAVKGGFLLIAREAAAALESGRHQSEWQRQGRIKKVALSAPQPR